MVNCQRDLWHGSLGWVTHRGLVAALATAAFLQSAVATLAQPQGDYTWTISASETDPRVHQIPNPGPGLQALYVWQLEACADGWSAAEFKIETQNWTIQSVAMLNGVLEVPGYPPNASGKNFLIAVGGCPYFPMPVAKLLVNTAGGSPGRLSFNVADVDEHLAGTQGCSWPAPWHEWPAEMGVVGFSTTDAGAFQASGNGCGYDPGPFISYMHAVQRPGTELVDVTFILDTNDPAELSSELYLIVGSPATACSTLEWWDGVGPVVPADGIVRGVTWNAGADFPGRNGTDYALYLRQNPYRGAIMWGLVQSLDLNTLADTAGLHIRGQVVDSANGQPIEGAEATLEALPGAPAGVTGPDGHFDILNIDPGNSGTQLLTVTRPGYKGVDVPVTLAIGAPARPVVQLETALVFLLHGIVSDGSTWHVEWGADSSFASILTSAGYVVSTPTFVSSCDNVATNSSLFRGWLEDAMTSTGVRSYSVVAHSAGGLILRQSLVPRESDEGGEPLGKQVSKFIMLGTPNHGTSLARAHYLPKGAEWLFCANSSLVGILPELKPGSAFLDRLNYEGNAHGLELECFGHSPENLYGLRPSRVYQIAGDRWLGHCSTWIDALSSHFLCGSDGVVPASSARLYASPVANYWTDAELGTVADHYSNSCAYTRNRKVAEAVRGILDGNPPDHAPGFVIRGGGPVAMEHLPVVAGVVEPGGSFESSTPVDALSAAAFECLWEADSLGYSLVSPSGVVIDRAYADTSGTVEFLAEGQIAQYRVASPESGVWMHRVESATNGAPDSVWLFTGFDSNLTLRLDVTDGVAPDGAFVCTAAFLRNAAPVVGSGVEVAVAGPDGGTGALTLRDDGTAGDPIPADGEFVGSYPAGGLTGAFWFVATGVADTAYSESEARMATDVATAVVWPDVAIDAPSFVIGDDTPLFGSVVQLAATFENRGSVRADTVDLAIENATLGTALAETTLGLSPGQAVSLEVAWLAVPWDSTRLVARAVVRGSQYEEDYRNNAASVTAVVGTHSGVTAIPEGGPDDGAVVQDPPALVLEQNTPNPFGAVTRVHFFVPSGMKRATVTLYDVAGRRVRVLTDRFYTTGWHETNWDGSDERGGQVANGVYFCRLEVDGKSQTRKMTLLR